MPRRKWPTRRLPASSPPATIPSACSDKPSQTPRPDCKKNYYWAIPEFGLPASSLLVPEWSFSHWSNGFITAQDGSDVFAHYSTIAMDGFKSLMEGEKVEFDIERGVHGPMAVNITKPGVSEEELPRINGVVTTFNAKKGYGTILAHDDSVVFVHYSNIKMPGFKFLSEDDRVEFSITRGVYGPMAIRVVRLSWDSNETGTSEGKKESDTAKAYHQESQREGTERSPWGILGVTKGASQNEIKMAYHHAAQMYHPDKVAGLAPEFRDMAERRMKEINAAYQELKHKSEAV
jgi:CspA family cold shock protein